MISFKEGKFEANENVSRIGNNIIVRDYKKIKKN